MAGVMGDVRVEKMNELHDRLFPACGRQQNGTERQKASVDC